MLYFSLSVLVLAALLFFPVSRLIWVLSVRRLQKREGRELDEAEARGQLQRARFISVPVVLAFSFFFNLSVVGMPGHG